MGHIEIIRIHQKNTTHYQFLIQWSHSGRIHEQKNHWLIIK